MNRPTQVIFLLQALFELSNGGSREYHYVPQLKTWSEAQRYCRENHIDLATIETEEEWSKVLIILQNANLDAWIGLYNDYTSWRWSLDGKYLYQDSTTPFSPWWTFSPSNSKDEYCSEITWGILNDVNCSPLKYPLCYNESTNSYFVISTTMNWTEAQSYCRLHHTDLTSVRNKQEKDTIFGLIKPSLLYWIGLSREGWKWSDKSTFLWNKWAPNEGLNTYSNEFCASAGSTGFIDGNCAQTKPFLCAVPMRKTYSIEIKSDTLNLEDLAEEESLLQNLEMEFKEHGIRQNFTLLWGKQANGKVFNKK